MRSPLRWRVLGFSWVGDYQHRPREVLTAFARYSIRLPVLNETYARSAHLCESVALPAFDTRGPRDVEPRSSL